MTISCPYCKWYLRTIAGDINLFECSNPACDVIIQNPPGLPKEIMEQPKQNQSKLCSQLK